MKPGSTYSMGSILQPIILSTYYLILIRLVSKFIYNSVSHHELCKYKISRNQTFLSGSLLPIFQLFNDLALTNACYFLVNVSCEESQSKIPKIRDCLSRLPSQHNVEPIDDSRNFVQLYYKTTFSVYELLLLYFYCAFFSFSYVMFNGVGGLVNWWIAVISFTKQIRRARSNQCDHDLTDVASRLKTKYYKHCD